MAPRAAPSASSGRIASAGGMSCCSRSSTASSRRTATRSRAKPPSDSRICPASDLDLAHRARSSVLPAPSMRAAVSISFLRKLCASAASASLFCLAPCRRAGLPFHDDALELPNCPRWTAVWPAPCRARACLRSVSGSGACGRNAMPVAGHGRRLWLEAAESTASSRRASRRCTTQRGDRIRAAAQQQGQTAFSAATVSIKRMSRHRRWLVQGPSDPAWWARHRPAGHCRA